MFGLDLWEVLIILVVALVVVGPRRLPEVARTLGRVMRELRRASNDLRRSIDEVVAEPPASRPAPPQPQLSVTVKPSEDSEPKHD